MDIALELFTKVVKKQAPSFFYDFNPKWSKWSEAKAAPISLVLVQIEINKSKNQFRRVQWFGKK